MKFLTGTERAQLRLQHKRERDSRICDRIKSVILFNDRWTPDNIAKALLITEDSVRRHIKEY